MNLPMGAARVAHSPFHDDFDVLEGIRGTSEFQNLHQPMEPIPFRLDRWELGDIPGRPRNLAHSQLMVPFEKIERRSWRRVAKEVVAIELNPHHPLVRVVPGGPIRHISPKSAPELSRALGRFFAWLTARGIEDLRDVTQDDCDDFLAVREQFAGSSALQNGVLKPLRLLYDYQPILSESLVFRPWGIQKTSRIVGRPVRESRDRWIPDEVLDPLVSGALFWVNVASRDVLAARDRYWQLVAQRSIWAGKQVRELIHERIDFHIDNGVPLPTHPTGKHTKFNAGVNVGLLALVQGAGINNRALDDGVTQHLRRAIKLVGTAPGGLLVPRHEVLRRDGTQGPWREDFDPYWLRWDLQRVVTGCWVTIAALSGMRDSELTDIFRGALEKKELHDGLIRYRVNSRIYKGQPLGGDPAQWTVIREVAEAIAVLEQLADPDDETPLLSHNTAELNWPTGKPQRMMAGRQVRLFAAWQNTQGAAAGLPAIPGVKGSPWPFAPHQFRHTLARQIAFRPHGTIAAKVHLKHVSAAVTEGYWGPASESADRFLREVEQEAEGAHLSAMVRRFNEYRNGTPIVGGGSKALAAELREIDNGYEHFVGTAEQRDSWLIEQLRKRAGTLHFNPLNDCHFTDPALARCRRALPEGSPVTGPLVGSCEPMRCGQATVHQDHAPRWKESVLQIDNLLDDKRVKRGVPAHERSRLQQERQRIAKIIEPFESH